VLAKVDTQQLDFRKARDVSRELRQVNAPDLWLRELLVESLPYFYLTAGFAAFYATLYISEWFWIVPHYLLLSAATMHIAILLFRQ
jgi:hypothetical protein